ncbi:hypothetical protein [Sphingomonas sp.]|uniref:hypothetical protein n=1 Tax=Sphingomonas sp. TaxID=28214 RepID=UPI001B1E607A|nr:hypothetical protein [Sphingomonas sp.]MBO9714021.1 hypothetical protein [Sphingomonas sp.]
MNRRFARAFAFAALAAAVPTPALAQHGALWVDDYGRMMTIEFAGVDDALPAPADRAPAEMAATFKRLCVETGAELAAIDSAASAAGLEAVPVQVPAAKKAPAATLGVWRASGLVVSQTGGGTVPQPKQCNAAFYVASLPDRPAVDEAMTAAFGPPANAAEAVRKGKPNRNYKPGWTVTGADGSPWTIAAFVVADSRYTPGNRVQISIRAAKKKAN